MAYSQNFQQRRRYFMNCAATIGAIFLIASPCCAQSKPAAQQAGMPGFQDLNKYPGLLPELGNLIQKLEQNVKYPEARGESRLLPLLPPSTLMYAAFPNYGDAVHQSLKVFHEELQESAVLRDWWEHGEMAKEGPKIEDSLEKLYQLHQYLGEEIVVSAAMKGKEPSVLIVAEVQKPGLKKFLQDLVTQVADKSKSDVRIFDPQELAAATDAVPPQQLVVLVRADFVVAASDLATLRIFNAKLDRGLKEFVSTPFGQRVANEYESGVTMLAAADLHKMINQAPPSAKENATFQNSGFADMKYFVWGHKTVDGKAVSQAELSFSTPRHGAAAWLANSGPLSSLDFVSPKAIFAGTVVLTNPAQILDDVKLLTSSSKSNPFAGLEQMEQALNISLKGDVLSHLTGELTVELDSITPPKAVWKVILKVNEAGHLKQVLGTLLAAAHFEAQQSDDGGVTYYTVRVPSPKNAVEIGYAFADGHLIVASSREGVAEAVRLHASGESLGKSQKLYSALPPGHSLDASVLLYQDPVAMAALTLQQLPPETRGLLPQFLGDAPPTVAGVYGEESAIREATKGGGFDVGAAMIVAAIAIPNLLRSRMAANEASAVGALRTVNTAQITYSATYPERGFAPALSVLGSDPRGPNAYSADHAGLIDNTLGNESCTANAWCTKSGYRFRVRGVCIQRACMEFVAIATPVDNNTGARSFCSTSNGVIRFKLGAPITVPISAAECKAWTPLR